jgi:hypothetical protein
MAEPKTKTIQLTFPIDSIVEDSDTDAVIWIQLPEDLKLNLLNSAGKASLIPPQRAKTYPQGVDIEIFEPEPEPSYTKGSKRCNCNDNWDAVRNICVEEPICLFPQGRFAMEKDTLQCPTCNSYPWRYLYPIIPNAGASHD